MMKKLSIIAAILAMLSSIGLDAEPYYYFGHFNTSDGLPSNTIFCTTQDRFGFMWIATRDGICRFDGKDCRSMSDGRPGSPMNGITMDMVEDEDGLMWFATSYGICCYDPYTDEKSFLREGTLKSLYRSAEVDGKGGVWFAGIEVIKYDKASREISHFSFEHKMPTDLTIDSEGTPWVAFSDGSLGRYDRRSATFQVVDFKLPLKAIKAASDGKLIGVTRDDKVLMIDSVNLSYSIMFGLDEKEAAREVNCVMERIKGEVWIGTNDGLFIRREGESYKGEGFHSDSDPNSITASYIYCLAKDTSNNIWAGTFYAGINIWQDREGQYSIYYENPSSNTMRGKMVRDITDDGEGRLWFCTEDGWLNCLDLSSEDISSHQIVKDLNMQGLAVNGDDLWVSAFNGGVYRYDRRHNRIKKHYIPKVQAICVMKTRDGDLLFGTNAGLYRYDAVNDELRYIDKIAPSPMYNLLQTEDGTIWVGTYNSGILCLDEDLSPVAHYTVSDKESGLTSNFITSLYEDSRHRIWVTTEGGGVCYTDSETGGDKLRFKHISKADGLTSDVTCAVAEDDDGVIWISTSHGISRFDSDDMSLVDVILERKEITSYQFSYGASHTTRNGTIYFGSTNGMTAFSPARMKQHNKNYPLYITSIESRNTDSTYVLRSPGKSELTSDFVKVKHRNASSLYISFAAPEYSLMQNVMYEYSIKRGRGKEIKVHSSDNYVNYAGLGPGTYTFNVKIMGSDDPIAHKTLKIKILAPPMESTVAKIAYIILLAGLIGAAVYLLLKKQRIDRARQLTKFANKKQKELYDAKISFFTSIAHEIRTPLTLIKMPLDKLISRGEYLPKAKDDMLTIQANTDRLLSLINQLLDLRKMEKNELRLSFLKEDIGEIVRKTCRYFEQVAREQHIALNTRIPDEPMEIMCAKDSVEKIVSNLLSNAVKYCKQEIDVSVKLAEDHQSVEVRVDSDGEGIPERDREKIFEIFYQRNAGGDSIRKSNGTGIGLPFARTLANLHKGRLFLDGTVVGRNSFVLELPVAQEEQITIDEDRQSVNETLQSSSFDSSRHSILVVEDTPDMRNYIAKELSDEYNILLAANGEDALDILAKEKVDLVISDIMMPKMDGCQLCNAIKTNMEYSHLPVILLTAAVGVETRIETLEMGADGYIEKPFDIELLRATISNLFKNKEIAYKQFTSSPLTHFNSVISSKIDEEFMTGLHDLVMKHLSEPDLSIETITTLLGTSKSTLYRKVKANTDLNINEYIRLCRLKQAAELLTTQKYRISEVTYLVGFSSPSYFTASFQKQFNISPSNFVKDLKVK